MQYALPYGKTTQLISIPESYSVEFVLGLSTQKSPDLKVLIEKAFSNPLDSALISDIIHTGNSVVIVVDDYTRPCPTKQLLPHLLRILKKLGIPASDITILIATGTHHSPNQDQLKQLLGKRIVQEYKVVSNDNKTSEYVPIGRSTFDHEMSINKIYVDADVKIILSDIEYHYFAGFGGTRKSILPGIASKVTIQQNHAMMFDEHAATGELEKNPVSIEMQEAFNMVGCDFCIGVVLDQDHQVVGIWTGDASKVMDQGVKMVKQLYSKKINCEPDVIITAADGLPHDINLYQSLKALHTASTVIKNNGSIVLAAECKDGLGNSLYQHWLERYGTAEEVQKQLKNHFEIGAHKAYYHRDIIERFTVYLSSNFHSSYVQKKLGFIPMKTIQESFNCIVSDNKDVEKILIVPNGSTTFLFR